MTHVLFVKILPSSIDKISSSRLVLLDWNFLSLFCFVLSSSSSTCLLLYHVQTRDGNKYFITFVDDSTKYCYVQLLKSKNEAIEKFVLYKNEVQNQLNKKIKVLKSELPFVDVCAQHGIIHETTTPYSPQRNDESHSKRNDECNVDKFWSNIKHVGRSHFAC